MRSRAAVSRSRIAKGAKCKLVGEAEHCCVGSAFDYADQIGLDASLLFTVTALLIVFVFLIVACLFIIATIALAILARDSNRQILSWKARELYNTVALR